MSILKFPKKNGVYNRNDGSLAKPLPLYSKWQVLWQEFICFIRRLD